MATGRQQPEWPDPDALAAAASVCRCCRRSSSPARRARCSRRSARSARAARSCSRPATASSRSTTLRARDPRAAQGAPADGGRADVRRDAPGRQGRADRRPVREAALVADGGRRRRRAPVVPRPHRPLRRADGRGARARSRAARPGLLPVRSTLNLLRAFTKGGFADLTHVHTWNREFVASSPAGRRYEALAGEIERALRFMQAIGFDLGSERTIHEVDVWTSHEGLLLDYEEPLTRTRLAHRAAVRLLGPHALDRRADAAIRTARTSSSSPASTTRSASSSARARRPTRPCALAERLNPDRIPGRLTFIARMGAEHVREALPPLLEAVREAEIPVAWVCDPMHANTVRTPSGTKTRHFDAIMAELEGFFAAHRAVGTWPGGIHIEFTGEDVTECLGGSEAVRRGAARPPLRDSLRPAPERAAVARSRFPRRRAHARRRERRTRMRLAVVGTGLIGASAALAARRTDEAGAVVGWDEDPAILELAVERGAVEPARVARGGAAGPSSRSSPSRSPGSPASSRTSSPQPRRSARSRTSAPRKAPCARPSATTRASSAATRSAAPRRAGPAARARICSRARRGS